MFLKKIQFSIVAFIISAVFASCSLPTAIVKAPLKPKEEIQVGKYKIVVHDAADSLHKFFKFRYYPVYHLSVLDESGAVTERYVLAWQEYLSRFAGELRPAQKAYLQGYPLFPAITDSAVVSWRFPIYEGEISDLKNVEPKRVMYWSLDKILGEKDSEEALILGLLSVPQSEPLKAGRKEEPEYREKIMQASGAIYTQMKKFLILELQKRQAAAE